MQTVAQGASGVASSVGEADKTAAKFVALPMASAAAGAAAGIVGGVVLERYGIKRPRKKVLGIPMPGRRNGLDGLTKQVGEAGKQFGKLASEVRTTREKAGEVGKALQ
jgi:Na+/glutamate symporter